MKILVYRDKEKEWRWTAIARNGKKVACSGEGYRRRATMLKTLKRIIDVFGSTVISVVDKTGKTITDV